MRLRQVDSYVQDACTTYGTFVGFLCFPQMYSPSLTWFPQGALVLFIMKGHVIRVGLAFRILAHLFVLVLADPLFVSIVSKC